ncbi:zinc ribbon domain-containing protein [Ruminococcus albus]|uniref:Zinc-ribbon domain-containing protein n=1 Tax=Ruminococcus albus TaxID=1264 RepID=A0A1H7I029_RUMAL|nr:zinc ribbon domain-containing protein [Ruminococcus albus]SEK55222.1 zinc-ribbon domain-containing protein [Ruminococcus albus]
MKFCAKCGAQMEDGMKFCGVCGAVVSDGTATQSAPDQQYGQTQQYNPQAAAAAPKQPNPTIQKIVGKVKKNPLIAVIPLVAIAAIIALICIIASVTKYQKIDAKDLFRFEYEGLNEHGTVKGVLNAYPDELYKLNDITLSTSKDMKHLNSDLSILEDYDEEDLAELTGGEKVSPYLSIDANELKKVWTKAKKPADLVSMRKALLQKNSKDNYVIKAKFDKEKDLKNGDKIKVTVDYDAEALKKANIKLTNTEFEIEVKNLEDGVEFDPFDSKYVKVEFSGIDGDGRLKIDTTADSIEGMSIYYSADRSSGLKNGDKVKVTCEIYSGRSEKSGDAILYEANGKYYVIKNEDALTKEYEVSGLTELKEIDPFENIKFEYRGGAPFLTIYDVDNDDMGELIIDNVDFNIDNGSNLKVGDKFKVKAYAYSSLKEDGYKLKGEVDSNGYYVKEFTVDDTMPAYVTAANGSEAYASADLKDLIADEESEVREHLQDARSSWLSNATNVKFEGTVEKVDSLTLKDVYVAFSNKNNYSNISGYVNRVYGVYEVKVKTDDEEKPSATFFVAIYINDVLYADGKYYKNESYSSTGYNYYGTMADFNKQVGDKEGYTLTKCGAGSGTVEKPDDSKPEETTTTTTAKPEKDDSKEEKADDSKAEEKKDEEKEDKKDKEKETEKADEKPAEEEEKAS